jgi:hypothetical protein
MFFPDKTVIFRNVLLHTRSTSSVAAGIVISAAMIVGIGAAQPSREAFSAVDRKDIQKMSESHVGGSPSRLVFLETDPARYAKPGAGETAIYLPQESPDSETGMASGYIQTF